MQQAVNKRKTKMKNKLVMIAVILTVFFIQACRESVTRVREKESVTGSGKIVTEERNIEAVSRVLLIVEGSFENMKTKNPVTLIIRQNSKPSLIVETDNNIQSRVKTTIKDGTLNIQFEKEYYNNVYAKIYLDLPSFVSINILGTAGVESQGDIISDNLSCGIIGAGNFNLSGSANEFNAIITGAGVIEAKNLTAKKSNLTIVGGGTITNTVTEELNANISGAGIITYYGNPSKIKHNIQGAGSIIKK